MILPQALSLFLRLVYTHIMKVAITGGHLTPSLAVIEELLKRDNVEIVYLGRKSTMEGDSAQSIESKTIQSLGIKFYPLTSGRLQRRITRYTLTSLLKIPFGFWQANKILKDIKPDVILSFGGYLALPVVIAAKFQGIKIITHEQTVVVGLANRIIAKFADLVAVSW